MQQQQRSPHIDVVLPREILAVYCLDPVVARNTCVVDDDINLELASLLMCQVVLCDLYNVLRTIFITHVGLDDDSLDTMLGLKLFGELLGDLLGRVRSVVQDQTQAFAGKVTGNCSTDTCVK